MLVTSRSTLYHAAALLAVMISMICIPGCMTQENGAGKPNIVFIMIDDLGYGDLGCYGNRFNLTPNIDRLAEQGLRFTDFHSNGPMCTPTRAAFMTGMYQHRLGRKFEAALSGKTQHDQGMPSGALTIAEVLKKAAYATGMFGKWHLGYLPPYLPHDQGFDEFRGLGSGDGDHHTHVDRWGRKDWWHNNKPKMEAGYSTDLITRHSVQFIRDHREEPFFLYVSHLAIHFPWQGPDDPAHRVTGTTYENDKWGYIPDKKNVRSHVKAMIASVDNGVGEIIRTLEELGLEKNTLVIFTSDNGGYIHYAHEFHNISDNGDLRGQKAEVYEGGHRVPFIAYWPGRIRPGTETDETVLTMDMYPTFAALAGAEIPASKHLDGVNILPVLTDQEKLQSRYLFWKMRKEKAVRKGPWKLIIIGEESPELYNLDNDIGEKNNISDNHPELVSGMLKAYDEWHSDVSDYAANFEQVQNN
jgi:arylsulfatase A-like enzyme